MRGSRSERKIDAQTQAYTAVEGAIAKAVASEAGADTKTVQRAFDVLVRKSYRKHSNRVAVGAAMVDDLRETVSPNDGLPPETSVEEIDEDWLNVFERYAEDASTERMQRLWGRVLSGEVRKPGKYSMRTLRFLSVFSQADGLTFSDFCSNAFGYFAPNKLVKPDDNIDIRNLIYLESSGLIQGATGFPLNLTVTLNAQGNGWLSEGTLLIMVQGKPSELLKLEVVTLTPLGQELMTLLPARDARAAARRVAESIRSPEIESAYLATNQLGRAIPIEILWQAETGNTATTF